jgi:multidrug resistance efflux pump
VTTIQPEKKTLRPVIQEPGTIEALEETPIIARIPGYVQKLHVDIGTVIKGPRFDKKGQEVQPGQLLAELWVPEREQEFKQKTALVLQADAEVEQAQGTLEIAEAAIETAKALIAEEEAARIRVQATYDRWESESRRFDKLAVGGTIDDQSRDEVRKQLKAADGARNELEAKILSTKAAVREAEAKRDKARADLKAAKTKVEVAKAEAAREGALLDYSKIRAPYDGVVTRRFINTRDFVQPATGPGAQPLFVVAHTDTVRIFLDVKEGDALLVQDGVPAQIRVLTIKDREFVGKVTRSAWTLDAKARTLKTEIDLPNPPEVEIFVSALGTGFSQSNPGMGAWIARQVTTAPPGRLRPGMYAYVTLTAELANRLTLPSSAVLTQGEQAFCFQVDTNKLVRTPIRLGRQVGTLVEVLKKQMKGAKPSDEGRWEDFTGKEVIVQGNLSGLSDGQTVVASTAHK